MKQRTAFVLPSLAHGGAQKVFLELVNYLSANGENVTLLVLEKEGELINQLPKNVNVEFLSTNYKLSLFKRLSQLIKLRAWVNGNKVSRVYSTITGMNLFVILSLLFKRDVRIVLREASSLENVRNKLTLLFMKLLYPRADAIICTSNYVKTQLTDLLGNDCQLLVIPNPLDMDRIKALSEQEVSQKLPEFSGLTVVAVGRLIEAKGFDVLVGAFSKVTDHLNARLLIIGEGPERENLESIVSSNGISNRVLMLGYQENPYSFMAQADLFVLSSRWEGYVNTMIEAMVLNLNIVATDCNSEPGNILNQELGKKLVPIDDEVQLANAIIDDLKQKRLVDYSEILERHNMSRAGRAYMEC